MKVGQALKEEIRAPVCLLAKAASEIAFESFYSFAQEKCFEMLGKLEKKVAATPRDELALLIVSVSTQNYLPCLSEENLQRFCHCFILSQMVWAKLVESRKDVSSLGLVVGQVRVFTESLEGFLRALGTSRASANPGV